MISQWACCHGQPRLRMTIVKDTIVTTSVLVSYNEFGCCSGTSFVGALLDLAGTLSVLLCLASSTICKALLRRRKTIADADRVDEIQWS